MPASVVVSIDPPRVQVGPGANSAATVVIRNRSEEVAHYLLEIEGLAPEWAEIVPNQVSAFPLQESRAQLMIHPPTGIPGATYHLIVRAKGQENSGLEGLGSLDVDVPAPVQVAPAPVTVAPPPPREAARPVSAAQIELRAEPLKESKVPPPAMQWKLSLKNASNVLDTYSFNISGVRPNWVSIEPAALTLKPGEEESALLTVRPAPDTVGGTYPFKLRAFSHLNLNQRTELDLSIAVRASSVFKLSVSPREAEAQGAREFKVSLSSDGASNSDLWIDLSASDQDNACDYTFDPNQVFLPARQTLTSTLRVVPHAVLGPNERKTYTVKVAAAPRDGTGAPQTDEVRLTQTGAKPMVLGLRPQVQSGEMGADYTVVITNPSGVPSGVTLAAEDPSGSCEYAFQPPRVAVPPQGQVQVILRLQARTGYAGTTSQEIPFTITATRLDELVPAAKADGKFTQLPLKAVNLFLIPPQQSQPGRARYFVKVRNPRSTPIHIWLDARDDEDALAFSFQPAEVQLSGGAEGTATLTARPKDKLPQDKQRRVHKFTVTGNVDGSRTMLSANGTLAQISGTNVPHIAATILRWSLRALKWAVAFLIVIFVSTCFLAGIDRISQTNPQLGRLVYSVLSPTLIRGLLGASPFTGPAQGIVYLVEGFINVLQPRH